MNRFALNGGFLRRAVLLQSRSIPSSAPVFTVNCHEHAFHPYPQQQMESINSQHHRRLQYRFIDHRKRKRKRKKAQCPYKILGVPETILYKDVKKKFLQIAMKNHPDRVTADHEVAEEEREEMREIFIKSRIAFESLTEDYRDGTAILVEDAEEDSMDNFDSWFKSETGFDTPFHFDMDPETMKEVAKMTENITGGESGLDRDGGMWMLARMVTSTVKQGGDAASMLRLEGGNIKGKDKSLNGVLRRRRKR